jgi:hypothetical protein
MRESRDQDDDRLPPGLERATQLLRASEAVRPAWRAALLEEVAQRPRGRVQLSIPMAIAAGIICAIGGAAVATIASHRPGETVIPTTAMQGSAASAAVAATLPVRFSVVAPEAASVSIVGDFNHWNPTTLPMRRSADGRHWEVEVRLPFGRYSYAFMIDGKISPDPAAPHGAHDDFGAPNSVLMVRGS